MMWCRLKNCPKCRGDLVLDGDEWRCWQCGQYYYPKSAVLEMPPDPPLNLGVSPYAVVPQRSVQKGRRGHRGPRNINSLIMAKDRSDRRWWRRNKIVVGYLDEGRSIRDIALLASRGERQIRVIRERLHDLRAPTRAPS